MGTYYAQLSGGDTTSCELANLVRPELIRQIHLEYLAAGARLLRTNTFAAAAQFGSGDPAQLRAIIQAGYAIASDCAGSQAYVAADIGPAYNLEAPGDQQAILLVLDTFLALKADLYIFETFADPAEVLPYCQHIRDQSPDSVLIVSFALSADGYTRKGLSIRQLSEELDHSPLIDLWGINCGLGPTHLSRQVGLLPLSGKPLSLMPNSGYPRLENQRLIYGSSPDYFAEAIKHLGSGRTRLLGGCCGTTPHHIKALQQVLQQPIQAGQAHLPESQPIPAISPVPVRNQLIEKLSKSEFVVVCELDPPRDSQMHQMIAAARLLQLAGLDALTLADSPLARVKMDPVSCAARLHRETGLPVLPHLCCRDRNVNSLRSTLLAAHSEGIRQILAITGDAIPESDQGFVKPVFNLNSVGLLQLIRQMNQETFAAEPILAAAALDAGVANPKAELAKISRKRDQGATVFLTQPIYDANGLAIIREARRLGLKVLIGLMPLVSYRNAQYLSQEVPGIRIPEAILQRFSPDQTREEAIGTGIAISREIAAACRQDADGYYLIAPFNRADIIIRLIHALRQDKLI